MPLIRYRTGDISRFHTLPCACGTVLKRLDRIAGRINDGKCHVSGMPLTLPVLDEALFTLPEVIDFKADLTSGGQDRDCLTITLSLSSEADKDAVAASAREKLAAIPAVRRTRLNIELPGIGTSGALTSGNQKRTLSDHRTESIRRCSD
jgi:phenylacetate-coenzyme A ligase PaaK-like adenylate-forming protein